MKTEVRMSRDLYEVVRADLERPHHLAAERLGFLFGRMGNVGASELLVLLHRYRPIAEERYIEDVQAGARIDGTAIRGAMQEVLDHRREREGVFHVHLHEHYGRPRFSPMDLQELPRLIPSFRSVGQASAHGILLLSKDHGVAWVWSPGMDEPVWAARITIVGAPLTVFETGTR